MKTMPLPGMLVLLLALGGFVPPVRAGEAAARKTVWICEEPALVRTRCLVQAALEDLTATYKSVGGGGITEIKALSTYVYQISISQEERIDLVIYEFKVKPGGETTIVRRTEGTE